MKIQFFAGNGVNYLLGEDNSSRIYAECAIPAECSEDYGYITMKAALLDAAKRNGIDTSSWFFWYDGQEEYLAPDASASVNVSLEIEIDDIYITE